MDKSRGGGYRAKNGVRGSVNELNSRTLLIIKLPDSRVLRIMSRSLFLAMLIIALPSIVSMMNRASPHVAVDEPDVSSDEFKVTPALLRDLLDEGLVKKGDKGCVLFGVVVDSDDDLEILRDAGVDLVIGEVKDVKDNVFDFVIAPDFGGIHKIDSIVKQDGGLLILPLGNDPYDQLRNYNIVYLRRFENTVLGMRKTMGASISSLTKRVLCGVTLEDKKAALNGLEDAYLEPPRQEVLVGNTKRSSFTSKKIKFLPDLLKDSLDQYPRRIFISDESSVLDWFYKNYPTRDQEFQIYNVEGVEANSEERGVLTWLTKHVKLGDYVVMKAEAQLVEEMLKDKTLCLVDELFLECKNELAYWQCLTLYGKVRDQGIAVHQWWS